MSTLARQAVGRPRGDRVEQDRLRQRRAEAAARPPPCSFRPGSGGQSNVPPPVQASSNSARDGVARRQPALAASPIAHRWPSAGAARTGRAATGRRVRAGPSPACSARCPLRRAARDARDRSATRRSAHRRPAAGPTRPDRWSSQARRARSRPIRSAAARRCPACSRTGPA